MPGRLGLQGSDRLLASSRPASGVWTTRVSNRMPDHRSCASSGVSMDARTPRAAERLVQVGGDPGAVVDDAHEVQQRRHRSSASSSRQSTAASRSMAWYVAST